MAGQLEQARFRREQRILAQLQHPHIASLIDAGVGDDGTPYLAMALVEGLRIDQYCEKAGIGLRDRVRLLLQVCAAVAYAHRQLVIHRDIKPGNILVDESGHATLLDFGIARLLDSDDTNEATITQAFTPDYAAPEQHDRHQVLGTAVDIYGLGAVLHRLLAGVVPQTDAHGDPVPASRAAREHGNTEAAAALRGDLDAIVGHALATDPARRYATVEALSNDLEAWLQHRPVQARRAGTWTHTRKFVCRNRAACALALVAALAVTAGLLSFLSSQKALRQRATELQAVTDFQTDMLQQIVPSDVGIHLHSALTSELEKIAPDAKAAHAAVDRIDYTGVAVDMLDEAVLKRSLKTAREKFAAQPRVQGQLLQQLANEYEGLGRLKQAWAIQKQVITLLRKSLGEGDPLTLKSLRDELEIVRQLNLPDDEAIHRKVLALNEHYLGIDSLGANKARQMLGKWLMWNGDPKAAEPILRKAAAYFENANGHLDSDAFDARGNLAYAIMQQGRLAEAVPLYRQLVVDSTHIYGADDRSTFVAENNLAVCLYKLGQTGEAEAAFRTLHQAQRSALGANDPATLNTLGNLSVIMMNRGNMTAAEAPLREAFKGTRAAFGEYSPLTRIRGYALAQDLVKLGKYEEATQLMDNLVANWQKGHESLLLTKVQRLLGRCLQRQGKVKVAMRAFEQSWLAAKAGKNLDEQRKTAKAATAVLAEAQSDAAERAIWEKRLQALPKAPPTKPRSGHASAAENE